MKKTIAKLLAGIAKGAIAAAKAMGKGGKAAWDFSVGAVSGAVGMIFGRGGGQAPQANAAEEIEEAIEANAAPDLDDEDELTPEEQFQKTEALARDRAMFGGPNKEPMAYKDVLDYANAPTLAKRQEIGGLMPKQTQDWLMSMTNGQLDNLGRAGEFGIKNHMTNFRHIANVPKLSFSKDYSGVELSHKEPLPKDFGKAKSNWTATREKIVEGFAARAPGAPAAKNEPNFGEGYRKQLDMMADLDQDREQGFDSAPAYRPKSAGMRR
ncbi:hypothetical protein B5E41_29110 [Rhizobium esperanzae]|uniref:Uncharacterized protein n=1 Tax=Rhizobium esperanzae TaxID=1967781 RepID=A0A246DL61_9HYPH|nr:hypothetical protein [Rhizobium esperanzae]OWO89988.1 hypothetical protein B5E41_29110 [Rhizobium esperanzae]